MTWQAIFKSPQFIKHLRVETACLQVGRELALLQHRRLGIQHDQLGAEASAGNAEVLSAEDVSCLRAEIVADRKSWEEMQELFSIC